MQVKTLKTITQTLLLAVIAAVPLVYTGSLYFPYVSGKVYFFRALVALAFFFWIWHLTAASGQRQESRITFKNILVVALVLFFLAQIASAFFGVDSGYSFFGSIERGEGVLHYGFWILFFLICLSVFNTERDWKLLFSVFIIVAVLSSGLAWITRALSPENPLVLNNPQLLKYQVQLHGASGNPAYFAAYLLFAIGFSFLAVERRFFTSKVVNNLLFASAGIFTLTLILTQIRGGYAGFAAGIFLFSLLSVLFLRKESKKLANFCGVLLLLGAISITSLFVLKESDFVQDRPLLSRVTEVADFWESDSVRERILNWNIALKAFGERPVFGYGPENYGAAFNKYYDFRVGVTQPWFDRAHSQPFDTLATGGIVVFSFYVFWLAVAAYLIFKIAQRQKMLSFILAGIFFAYFTQGLFLFDTMQTYLGLFLLLAYLVFLNPKSEIRNSKQTTNSPIRKPAVSNGAGKFQTTNYAILVAAGVFSAFLIYSTVFAPYKANAAAFQFFFYSEHGLYEKSEPYLKKSFSIRSPYTFWEMRKRTGWQFSNALEYEISENTPSERVEAVREMYGFFTEELEKFLKARPTEPQIYYVLGRIYRLGSEKLGFDDLQKAEAVFQKSLEHSDSRVEYFNEYAKVLLLQGKFEEGEKLVKDYVARVSFFEYFPYTTLGHFYFVAGKYDLAFEEYEKARAVGYPFFLVEPEYARYLFAAEHQKEYERVVETAKAFLERWGPDADTYFNIAVGYMNLEKKEEAREFFLKAVELKPKYEEYREFFTE